MITIHFRNVLLLWKCHEMASQKHPIFQLLFLPDTYSTNQARIQSLLKYRIETFFLTLFQVSAVYCKYIKPLSLHTQF